MGLEVVNLIESTFTSKVQFSALCVQKYFNHQSILKRAAL